MDSQTPAGRFSDTQRRVVAPVGRMAINHANVSRADMQGRAVGGRDEVILDMTGQAMTVRVMSENDMAAAPFAPALVGARQPAPLARQVAAQSPPAHETSFTYGVPVEVAERMSPEEQVMAQQGGRDTRPSDVIA